MLLTHARGAVSVVECSYASRPAMEPFPQTSIEIEGDAGSIRLDPGYRMTVVDAAGTHHYDVSPPLLAWAERPWHNVQESVFNIQRHWVDCFTRGAEPATSGRDNLKTLALVEAAYESAATGKAVTIPS
jgi:predicted dehydrogenase